MITEFRRLVLSIKEIEKAISAFNKHKVAKLPAGDIVGLEIVDNPKIGARVRVKEESGSAEEHEVTIDADYLGAAIIFHCQQNRIPMPRSPKKTLERVGEGLALSFSINAIPESAAPTGSEASGILSEGSQGKGLQRGQGQAVLVLEDDPDVRAFTVATLEMLGYQVHEAADANAATRVLDDHADSLDVLLSDVVLPGGVNGPQFAKQAKERCPELKIVIMTGFAPDPAADDAISKITQSLLWKPFKRADLARAMRDALET